VSREGAGAQTSVYAARALCRPGRGVQGRIDQGIVLRMCAQRLCGLPAVLDCLSFNSVAELSNVAVPCHRPCARGMCLCVFKMRFQAVRVFGLGVFKEGLPLLMQLLQQALLACL
jgi:hypothetical protein